MGIIINENGKMIMIMEKVIISIFKDTDNMDN